MKSIAIKLLGVGSIDINVNDDYHIYIDSFNSINQTPSLNSKDIIIFTHADGDHFSVESLITVYKGNTIIGPPSIVFPLMKTGIVDCNKLFIEYPEQINIPKSISINDITVSFYQSKHFIDWHPIHCSYLLTINNRSIYITGDSNIEPSVLNNITFDCIICNLVDKGYITKTDNPKYAIHHHLSYLLNILANIKTDKIIANHLLGFDGTIEPKSLKELVEHYCFRNIIVPETIDETVFIE